MQLKRIELRGFKSFAERTTLQFVPGMTAVVGPNGSGKSNVADAIRWVLGEQSAKSLRGTTMQELIFAGSEGRAPSDYCEVILTLDNVDRTLPYEYAEVTVMRRLYRSGESEFSLNQMPCRLKDIVELFMDTGIGRESYSVIGQGRIDEVLSTRPEERRAIFEEASGIVKYKLRKKESLRKLSETDDNVRRIEDILTELDTQREPLGREAQRAQQYAQWHDALKNVDVARIVHEIDTTHQAWIDACATRTHWQEVETDLALVVHKHDVALETHHLLVQQRDAEVDGLQQAYHEATTNVEHAEANRQVLDVRLAHATEQCDASRKAQTHIALKQAMAHIRRQEVIAHIQRTTEALQHIEQAMAQYHTQHVHVSPVFDEQSTKTTLFDVLHALATVRNERLHLLSQEETHAKTMQRIEEQIAQKQAEQAQLITVLAHKKTQHLACTKAIKQCQQQRTALEETIQHETALHAQHRQMVTKEEQKLHTMRTRLHTLQELHDGYDGFASGVREVLKASEHGTLHHIRGAVATLITVEPRWELALETALGGALQHIVVTDEQSAREAIRFLKAKQLGRATFLPMDVIRPRTFPTYDRERGAQQPGWVGVASDVVRCDASYRDIIEHLLGNVVIVEKIEEANRIARTLAYRYRIVTCAGDVVHTGGSMTGGSVRQTNATWLARQRHMGELAQHIDALQHTVAQQRQHDDQMQQRLATWQQQCETLQKQEDALRQDAMDVAEALTKAEHSRETLLMSIQQCQHEQNRIAHEQQENKTKKLHLEAQMQQYDAQQIQLQQQLEQSTQQRDAQWETKTQHADALATLRIEQARLQETSNALHAELVRLDHEVREWEHTSREQVEKYETYAVACKNMEAQLAEQAIDIAMKQQQKAHIATQLAEAQAHRQDAHRLRHDDQNQTKEQRQQLRHVTQTIRQCDVQVNRLEVQLEHALRQLAEQYELSYETAKAHYPLPADIDTVNAEVQRLKQQLAQLGTVHMGAIVEYERIDARYAFLSAQCDDLRIAKQRLQDVLREMDEEMTVRFMEAYEAIRRHFQDVFSQLFGGGTADFILTQPQQGIDSGIDIVAQPPGKKLQNLQLLSGGERALTAVCLLFAMLRYKPVPFCVLDEVEAALDEANVTRFAQYLRQFCTDTQFILVTHRKGTMAAADVLYGITMEERGVSKLISVRFAAEGQSAS